MFGLILISVCSLMHIYVFWRAASVPLINRHVSTLLLIGIGLFLWLVLVLGRFYGHENAGTPARVIEMAGMTWIGALLLLSTCFLAVDLITGFGFLWPRHAPMLRGWALVVGGILSAVALIQGLRPPVIESYEVGLPGLPREMDGTVVIGMSDWHIGSLIGTGWLAARIAQARAQDPDLVVLLGDLLEGHGGPPAEELIGILQNLSAPLGVWAVLGNHEYYGRNRAVSVMAQAGFQVLRNEWVEIRPGFVVAGVDDLSVHRRRGKNEDLVTRALVDRPEGATILLSHTPWETETAARSGVELMLCGHTHGGQIWPFRYLVRRVYPLMAGQYTVDGMSVIVCRGTGRWGPPMRLWPPGEILRVILRAEEIQQS